VDGLALPDEAKQRLRDITPASYIGNAAQQAKAIKLAIIQLRMR